MKKIIGFKLPPWLLSMLLFLGLTPLAQATYFDTTQCSSGKIGWITMLSDNTLVNPDEPITLFVTLNDGQTIVKFSVSPKVAKQAGLTQGEAICTDDATNTPKVKGPHDD